MLLHIGVHKTGTTAIQAALADARPELKAAGVAYPGKAAAHHSEAFAVLQRPWGWSERGGSRVSPARFDRLAKRVSAHTRAARGQQRVLLRGGRPGGRTSGPRAR